MYLITKRLIIRDLSMKDVQSYYNMCKNEHVAFKAGWDPHPNVFYSRRILKMLIHAQETWGVYLKDTQELIGTINLYNHPIRRNRKEYELGYALNEDYWNQGYITEAVSKIINEAFTHNSVDSIFAMIDPSNLQSKRVLEKNGFRYEGTLKGYTYIYTGELIDGDIYSIEREEYKI